MLEVKVYENPVTEMVVLVNGIKFTDIVREPKPQAIMYSCEMYDEQSTTFYIIHETDTQTFSVVKSWTEGHMHTRTLWQGDNVQDAAPVAHGLVMKHLGEQ